MGSGVLGNPVVLPLEADNRRDIIVHEFADRLEGAEREHILARVKETKWVLSGPRGRRRGSA